MLFSKLRAKSDELLPPPPPFPSMELEEKPEERPEKQKAPKDDFDDLFKEVESLKLGKGDVKKEAPKKIKIKKPIARIKPVKIKPLKAKLVKKLPQIKIKAAAIRPIKAEKPRVSKHELEFPAEEPKIEDIEFPELGEKEPLEFIENIESKPREIQEAEDEIKSAIEKIREREKPSFFRKLFGKKEQGIMEMPADDVSAIKKYIEYAREALMKFDLEAAKMDYIEIMRIYNRIAPQEQARVYQEISDLYSERKSAEELKV